MRPLLAMACLLALAGCLGDATPTPGADMAAGPDMLRLPGMPGDPCRSVCDCGFGLACTAGKCTPTAFVPFCCARPMCPPAMACEQPNGGAGVCPGTPPDLAMMMPPPAPDLSMRPMQDGGMPPPPDGGMMGPKSCTSNADCPINVCPPGSKGCTCSMSPMGQICAPTCTVAADCPMMPMMPAFQCRMGVCAP